MAMLYRADGTTDTIHPGNGIYFNLEELQTLVGGYIEIVRTHNGLYLVCDENGKVADEPKHINLQATELYQYGAHDPIVGDAVVGTLLEIDGPPDEQEPEVHELTQLEYAVPVKGESFRIYILDADGMHMGGQWFRRVPVYLDEEITVDQAKTRADVAIKAGNEVRVTDSGDQLVYHVKDGRQLYPAGTEDVWEAM